MGLPTIKNMETVTIQKEFLSKILTDVETLIDDVELALDSKVIQRAQDVETGKVTGRTEKDLDNYLKRRGVKIERMGH